MGRLPGTMVIPLSHLGKWLPFKKLWGKHVCLPIPVGWNGASSDHYYANIDLHIWYGVLGHEVQTRLRLQKRPLRCWSEERWLDLRATLVLHLRLKRFSLFSLFLSRWMVVQGFRDESNKRYRLNGLCHHSFLILRTCKQWQCPQQRWSSTKWKLNILFHIQIT